MIYSFTKNGYGCNTANNMQEFKKKISQLAKIRHENIMLFMGACIEPNCLSVITR